MKGSLRALLEKNGIRLTDLADAVGVNKSTVTRWAAGVVPAERVLTIETATGIPRHKIRPDIYPRGKQQ